ncbi:MAG: helix-turn-helix transcriptional regulator [Calditrichaeota bacterium]|nr:helix-turn-helix transcriptional regulator [Calditrichota bacterium]
MPRIGERIREARKRAGLSQEALADRIGVNRSYLSLVENGKSSPTFEFVEKIAGGMSLRVEDIVLGERGRYLVYDAEDESPMYEGLAELLQDESQVLLMNITDEEKEILRTIRLNSRIRPSKQFFIQALLDFRKSKQPVR